MDEQIVVKKVSRARKTVADTKTESAIQIEATPTTQPHAKNDMFNSLIEEIKNLKDQFDVLEKEISETRQAWVREQTTHQQELAERDLQEQTQRKREQEAYQYETNLANKKMEDEFSDRKMRWEKELQERKEELLKDKKELEELRRVVADFDEREQKAIQEAALSAREDLETKHETEKRLHELEIKSEKEMLNLKIANLTLENNRQVKEVEDLKKALDEATRQVKEIAVKVIESSGGTPRTIIPE